MTAGKGWKKFDKGIIKYRARERDEIETLKVSNYKRKGKNVKA